MKIRYIDLGDKAARTCIELKNIVRLELPAIDACLQTRTNVDRIRAAYLVQSTPDLKQAPYISEDTFEFYQLTDMDIFITIYQGALYWCRSYPEVSVCRDGSLVRKVKGRWSHLDYLQQPLMLHQLDGRIASLQHTHSRITATEIPEYIEHKIMGRELPDLREAKQAFDALKHQLVRLIKGLWWSDFISLVHQTLSISGWLLYSTQQSDSEQVLADVVSLQTKEHMALLVLHNADIDSLTKHINGVEERLPYSTTCIVLQTFEEEEQEAAYNHRRILLAGPATLAELSLKGGLVDWILSKRS